MNEHRSRRIVPDISRRRFLQGSALAGFGAFLAACGTSGTGSAAPSTRSERVRAGLERDHRRRRPRRRSRRRPS